MQNAEQGQVDENESTGSALAYEVELKFVLTDLPRIQRCLQELQARADNVIAQRDVYFAHPQRDFATTNEALRVRRYNDDACVTYKGPLLDTQTKTRREIEIPFADGKHAGEQFEEMLAILGFRPVRAVVKRRQPFHLTWQTRPIELVLDEVDGLGTFLEIESLATESDRDAAKQCILSLAEHLGLSDPEPRSYLRMLLESDAADQ